jgi:predicted RNA binding protein YcfA (HicA-like mRNA interferase family)
LPKPKKPDDVFRILRAHDARFQFYDNRGKGSHRMIEHPDIQGQRRACPIPYHKGRDVKPGILRQIIRRFDLPHDIFG